MEMLGKLDRSYWTGVALTAPNKKEGRGGLNWSNSLFNSHGPK